MFLQFFRAVWKWLRSADSTHTPKDRTDELFPIITSCDLEEFFFNNRRLNSDLTIKVNGRSIYVHKHILKTRCTYFENMFRFNGLENNQRVITNNDHPYIVYKAFLKYLYTGEITLSSLTDLIGLSILSDKYCVENLERDCIQAIKKKIIAPNIYSIKQAIKYGKERQDHGGSTEEPSGGSRAHRSVTWHLQFI